MRLVETFKNPEYAQSFSNLLHKEDIEHELEITTSSDWGDDNYGAPVAALWITHETDIEQATSLLEKFKQNPVAVKAPKFVKAEPMPKQQKSAPQKYSATLYLIILCSILFAWGAAWPYLFFDWPETKPVWQGVYPKIIAFLQGDYSSSTITETLFEKIREGEVWRLFTPALLHANIFHLFFNLMWLLSLGRQMEERLGVKKYLFFILITGIFSNTCQYLMSGPSFLGISGVLAAMLTYIWIRQKKAPWEGYQLQPGTYMLLSIFILAMLGLQVGAFIYQVLTGVDLPLRIANTAHIAGALLGYLLGKLNFFSWKRA